MITIVTSTMEKLNPDMLRLAREARSLTQEDLAGLLNIEQGTLSKIEKNILTADETTVKNIATSLNFPATFFYQEQKIIPIEGHYRRKISTSVKKMKQYTALMTLAEMHFLTMLDEIELPETKLPQWDILEDGSPALCAKHLREFWLIPKGRIANLVKWTEDHGVSIIPLDLEEMDGFSTFINGNIPVIFINKNLPPDRFRLTIAHELGHLILHFRNKIGPDRDLEAEAYEFAIELLVPENGIRAYFTKLSIEKLADLKSYWYVSMAALLKYANTLEMVTGNQYRYLWMQMGSLGFRRNEPVTIPKESPGLIREMIDAYLSDLGYTKEELASVLHITLPELEDMYLDGKRKLKIIRN